MQEKVASELSRIKLRKSSNLYNNFYIKNWKKKVKHLQFSEGASSLSACNHHNVC